MQDRDFEEQVHKKMEELLIAPSEAVWQEVDRRLHQKEKRRRWIIWLPFLLAGFATGGYLVVNQFKRTGTTSLAASSVRLNPPSTAQLPSKGPQVQLPGNGLPSSPGSETSGIPVTPRDASKTAAKLPALPPAEQGMQRESQTGRAFPADQPSLNDSTDELEPGSTDEAVVPAETGTTSPDQRVREPLSATPNWLLPGRQQVLSIAAKAPIEGALTSAPVIMPKKSSKWTWGVTARGGRSSISKGVLNNVFGNRSVADMQFATPASPNNQTGQAGLIIPPPSAVHPGLSLAGGIYVQRRLSERVSLSVGADFNWASTRQKVGLKVNNSTQNSFLSMTGNTVSRSNFYLSGSSSYQTNYFYLELPIILQTRLSASTSGPLYWDIGLSLSRLVSTNALHYSQATGVYYADNSLIKKTSLNLLTGLPVRVFSGRSLGLQLGPEIRYGATDLIRSPTETNKRLLFFGLKAKLRLGNK